MIGFTIFTYPLRRSLHYYYDDWTAYYSTTPYVSGTEDQHDVLQEEYIT